ncbi:hypothetical protein EV178_001485 [Coemansia sp. RSA 1646]|nr:hypothetical protein EV178_001485 [Coemansia sp. RSA 1646]
MDDIATFYAQHVSKAVPNISKLVCFNDSLLPLPKTIDGKIADAFANQLQLFTSLGPLRLATREFSSELTWLRFCLDEKNTSLTAFPRAFSRSLQYLCIYYMSDEVAWQLFVDNNSTIKENGSQTKDITFEHLTQLELHYFFANDGIVGGSSPSDTRYTSKPGYKLRFPRLKRLRINGCPSDCVFFASSELPSNLVVLNIEGMLDAIEALSRLDLPAIEILRFQQSPGVPLGWWQNNTEALSGFLDRHCGSKCTGLLLQPDTDYRLAPHVLEKAKIIHLSIGKVIGIADMLEVIATLPDLVKLVVHSLAFRGMPTYVTDGDSCSQDNNGPQQPKTRIREIVLWDNYQKPLPQEAKQSLTKYLLKWLPTLIKVRHS